MATREQAVVACGLLVPAPEQQHERVTATCNNMYEFYKQNFAEINTKECILIILGKTDDDRSLDSDCVQGDWSDETGHEEGF